MFSGLTIHRTTYGSHSAAYLSGRFLAGKGIQPDSAR